MGQFGKYYIYLISHCSIINFSQVPEEMCIPGRRLFQGGAYYYDNKAQGSIVITCKINYRYYLVSKQPTHISHTICKGSHRLGQFHSTLVLLCPRQYQQTGDSLLHHALQVHRFGKRSHHLLQPPTLLPGCSEFAHLLICQNFERFQ